MSSTTYPRALVERVTRKWVFPRRLPAEFGAHQMLVTPAAGLKFLFKPMAQTDPHLFRNVRDVVRPGDVVWDIGANIGLFAFAAAAIAGPTGQVFAFEPDTWLVEVLRRSSRIQPETSAPTTIVPAAVASAVALRTFAIASRARASNAIVGYGHSQMGSVAEEQTIISLSLDWLATRLPRPNVIKCDVEGAELEVFSDQPVLLKEIRPVIICEVCEKTRKPLSHLLKEAGYRFFDSERSLQGATELDLAPWNVIAIPEEKVGAFTRGA
jgi:FkbM family methyltransferase